MTFAFRPPTETEMAAVKRRRAFHESIAAKADELKAAKMRAAVETLGTPIAPEAMPAEPDPPALCPHCGGEIALDAEPVAAPLDEPPAPAYPPIAKIQAVVGKFYNVTRNDLCSARRQKDIVRPRQISYYLCRELTPFSMPVIGRMHGDRDHTSILSGVRKINRLLPLDAELAHAVATLTETLSGRGAA